MGSRVAFRFLCNMRWRHCSGPSVTHNAFHQALTTRSRSLTFLPTQGQSRRTVSECRDEQDEHLKKLNQEDGRGRVEE